MKNVFFTIKWHPQLNCTEAHTEKETILVRRYVNIFPNAGLLSAKALETSLCRMWGSGHNFIGSISTILRIQYCCLRGSGSSKLNYAEFFEQISQKRQAPAESNCGEEEQCQEKEPKTTEATKDSSSWKRYEEKRKQEDRTFQQEWKKTFVWLQFDKTKQEMFCTACREFSSLADKTVHFLPGAKLSPLETLKHMQAIVKHEACILAKQQREQQERRSMNIVQSLRQMSSDTEEKMKKLFDISYFITKHERPFSDFEDLCKLHVKNGLSLGETYINDKGCHIFVDTIDGVMKEDESHQVNKQHFTSVMADNRTDTSNKDIELVYVKVS